MLAALALLINFWVFLPWCGVFFLALFLLGLAIAPLQVFMYRHRNPKVTAMMRYNRRKYKNLQTTVTEQRSDLPIEAFPDSLINVVDSAEDLGTFLYHNGFLAFGIKKAYLSNHRGNCLRGGSTISQQTAKNCFLTPKRIMIRKIIEVYYTWLIEKMWGKKRIMECYLNIVELGKGIYGFEAACRHYFHHSICSATEEESILLAALLPCPSQWSPHHPTPNY